MELQFEVDIETVGVGPDGVHLGADRDRRVAVVLGVDLERPFDGGVRAVGGDHGIAVHLLAAFEGHAGDPAPFVEDRPGDFGALADDGAGRLGVLEQQRVEFGTADAVAVVGHTGAGGKSQFPLGRAVHRHPVDPVELRDLVSQAHFLQVTHGPGGQTVTARLVPGEHRLIENHHLGAGLGSLPGSRRPRRATSRNHQVESLGHSQLARSQSMVVLLGHR